MIDLHERLRTLLFLVPFVVRHRGVLLSELAARLGLSEQQLLKDFDLLLMVGRPPFLPNNMLDIYHEGGRVYVDLNQSLDQPPRFTVFEALALAVAAQLFAGQQKGVAGITVRTAVRKVVGSLPKEAQKLYKQLSLHYLIISNETAAPHLDLLRKAVQERREVGFRYFTASRRDVTARTVKPYGLHYWHGMWYLAAYCTHRKACRVFRLSRIQQAKLTDRTFDPPEDFNVAEFVEGVLAVPASGARQVVVRFSPEASRWIQERWAPKYLTAEPDGSVIVRLHDVSDEYVLSYVASFGGEATIEAPAELADTLRRQAGEALRNYI